MKKLLLLTLALGLVAGGCATDNNSNSSTAKTEQKKPSEKNPEVGMTKAQIVELYGKTDNIQASSEGETWIYNMNMGEAFIPFNFGYRPKMRIIVFDQNGTVKSWSYSK
ncbi:MAG: hypothetical protein JWQ71_1461 [Pedosphaera sp.]|nr:hypothetical protein [Pedosphaera sp.]